MFHIQVEFGMTLTLGDEFHCLSSLVYMLLWPEYVVGF